MVLESSSLNHGEEVPTEFGFGGGVEKKRNHFGWVGFIEERGEARADTGGIDDDVTGIPEFGEGFELGVEGGMAGAGPEFAVADQVSGSLDEVVFEGG